MRPIYFLLLLYLLFPLIGYVQTRMCDEPATVEDNQSWNCYHAGKKLIKWGLWAGAFALLGSFLLMGLPGALLAALYDLLGLAKGVTQGDKLWPAAIMISLLWPLGIPLGLLLQQLAGRMAWQAIYPYSFWAALILWILLLGKIIPWMK